MLSVNIFPSNFAPVNILLVQKIARIVQKFYGLNFCRNLQNRIFINKLYKVYEQY